MEGGRRAEEGHAPGPPQGDADQTRLRVGTSKYAFDGSGEVARGKDADLGTYSLCRFPTGKVYNCDLSAAQNIGARFFLREYAKLPGCPGLPKTPRRTYDTLVSLVRSMAA